MLVKIKERANGKNRITLNSSTQRIQKGIASQAFEESLPVNILMKIKGIMGRIIVNPKSDKPL